MTPIQPSLTPSLDVEAVRQSTMPHQHDNRIQETEITEYKIKKSEET